MPASATPPSEKPWNTAIRPIQQRQHGEAEQRALPKAFAEGQGEGQCVIGEGLLFDFRHGEDGNEEDEDGDAFTYQDFAGNEDVFGQGLFPIADGGDAVKSEVEGDDQRCENGQEDQEAPADADAGVAAIEERFLAALAMTVFHFCDGALIGFIYELAELHLCKARGGTRVARLCVARLVRVAFAAGMVEFYAQGFSEGAAPEGDEQGDAEQDYGVQASAVAVGPIDAFFDV